MPIAVNHQTGETVYLADDGQWQKAQTAVNPQTKEMLAFDGKAWQPVPAQSKGVLGYIDDAVRSIASGVTFGYADELAAKGNELFGSGTYEENLAVEKRRDQQIPAALKIPGEIAGAVGGVVAAAPVAGPAALATGLMKLPAVARMIGGGAAGGAAFGSGEANPGQRGEGAAKGALIGAAAGAAAPYAVRAVGTTARAVRDAFSPRAQVAADIERAIARDGDTPAALLDRTQELQAIRPGVATVADAGGENVRGLVERVAQTPGAGRTTVVPALTQRQQGQMARLGHDLRHLTGTQRTAAQAVSETMEQRATSARPLYDEAFNFNARDVPEIVRAFENETATGFGRSMMLRPEFRRTLQTEYGIQNPADAPLMVVIDAWKKTADDYIGNNLGSNSARVVGQMRDRVLSVVDQHNPAYATARNAWAGPSRYLDAINEGRNILNTRIGSDELNAALRQMSEADREGFRIGAVSAIIGKMGADPARLGDMTKYLRSPEMRAKIAALMPTQEARDAWARRLDFEVSSSELVGRSLGNSATARRLAERQDADSIVGDLVMDVFARSPPTNLLRRAIGAVPRRIRDTLRSQADNILAELLTDPAAMQGVRAAIARVQQRGNVTVRPTRDAAAINATNAALIGN